jgi:hypothetical protein
LDVIAIVTFIITTTTSIIHIIISISFSIIIVNANIAASTAAHRLI